jgi:hypothetical protein
MMNRIISGWTFVAGPGYRAHHEASYLPFVAGRLLVS